ncbi:MAG: HAD hydrolase family protein, partial [Desulfovibrionaceae bacterium]|nr:HAD hydrolase family protein [Desulfovibrionaceae bacterium]
NDRKEITPGNRNALERALEAGHGVIITTGRPLKSAMDQARKLGLDSRGVCNVELEVLSDETGKPLQDGQAYYIRYLAGITVEEVGPFHAFADAAAMHEALRQAHPEAEMVMDEVTERP